MSSFIRLHSADDVVIARAQLMSGSAVEGVPVRGLIPPGHKIATRAITAGEPVRRYNQIIGFASQAIAPGEHVHTHNLNMGAEKGNFARDYAFCADVKPDTPRRHATFQGIVRADGRVATRNYIGILSSVNCSATAARAIADHFSKLTNPAALADFPNIDGVVALTHGTGCGMDTGGTGMQLLERTLAGYATHANFAGAVVVGLGCEANQLQTWLAHSGLQEGSTLHTFNIQDTGGTAKTVAKGIEFVKRMLPAANAVERVPCMPPLPAAAGIASRLRRSRVGDQLLVLSPSCVGVVTLPPRNALQTSLMPPAARCVWGGCPRVSACGAWRACAAA
jgi:altronate hydrolase